jgi:Tol biopolymer transport system component
MKDLDSGKQTAVTLTPFEEENAVFNRDGTKIAYNRSEDQQWPIYVAAAGQPGVPEKVCDDCRALNDSSSDGSRLLYTRTVDARTPIAIELLNIISREKIRLIKHPTHTLFSPRFSPDDGWVSFHEFTGLASRRIYVARLRGNTPAPGGDWVPITDGLGLDRDACWAPDGSLLYFYSERDGFPCIWAQQLEPQTKRPRGDAFPVYHMHHARRSVRTFDDLSLARLSTAPGKLVFSMGEYSGNIWMATLQR